MRPHAGGTDVWRVETDGSSQTNLTESPSPDSHPAWSPDGSRIAFQSSRDRDLEVFVVAPDGSGLENLTDGPGRAFSPSWSPDGTRIAYTHSADDDSEIAIVALDGSGPMDLTDQEGDQSGPAWQPWRLPTRSGAAVPVVMNGRAPSPL